MARLRKLRSLRYSLSRFGADKNGATAVEFGLIAFPFFSLLFAIMQTSMVMFGSQALQTMTSLSSRKIMTGEMKAATFDQFKNAMCPALASDRKGMAKLFDCQKMFVQVQAFDSFSASDAGVINPKCFQTTPPPPANECYKSGLKEQFVIVQVAYDWPYAVNLETLSRTTRITAVAAFRNEPF